MHMLICIIIFPVAPYNTTFRPVPTSACQCLSESSVCVVLSRRMFACLASLACCHEDDVCAGLL